MRAMRWVTGVVALVSFGAVFGGCHLNLTSGDGGTGSGTSTSGTTTSSSSSASSSSSTTSSSSSGTPLPTHSLFIDVPTGTFVGMPNPTASVSASAPVLENGSGPDTLINGGSGLFNIGYSDPGGAAAVKTLIVAADGDVGYFTVALDGTGAKTATVTIDADVQSPDLTLGFAVMDGNGACSDYWVTKFNLVKTGTGDVKVALSFDKKVDVDLHVVEPSGEDVYYSNPKSATGGALDLDSNAGCTIDGVDNEDIFWAAGSAAHGIYTVRVDYFQACDPGPVNYVVTVHNGTHVETFTGKFTEVDADSGGQGSGHTITTFTY